MDIFIIIVLVVAAVILFLVELFIVPGISIAGFLAGGCIIYANYYAFTNIGTTAGFITLAVSAIACVGSLIWFMRSKTLDKIALKEYYFKDRPKRRRESENRRHRCYNDPTCSYRIC